MAKDREGATRGEAVRPRVYLAGPGVFRLDAKAFGDRLKAKCAGAGLDGYFPLDGDVAGDTPTAVAGSIFRANRSAIDAAQAIVADISPFRGPNMDPGTAWEIGYGHARGIPVFAWTTATESLLRRTVIERGSVLPGAANVCDRDGWIIEDFALTENLMIAIAAASIHENEDGAIAACAASFAR